MARYNVSINTYFGIGEHTRFSIRVWHSERPRGWVTPIKHVTGRVSLPESASPTEALRTLLWTLHEQL